MINSRPKDLLVDGGSGAQPNSGAVLRRAAFFLLGCVVVAVLATCFVFVDEREAALVERFGNIVAVYDRDGDRGAHLKLPWPIDVVRRFDRRVQLFDPPSREMFTSDKKNVTLDVYVCWKIADPPAEQSASLLERPVVRFYRGLGSVDLAEARLDSRVRSILTTAIGQVELGRLLGVKDSEQGPPGGAGPLEEISDSVRNETMRRPGENGSLRDRLGIEIVDLRIARLNFPTGNQQAVFERMKSERKKIADRYRSAGLAENLMIRSQADRQYNELLAHARADAERIRGTAEAEAVRTLNAAHAQDPDFYSVMATLDAYRKILNEKTTLVLSASSSLLKMLSDGVPELKTPPTESPRRPASRQLPDATTKAGNSKAADAISGVGKRSP